MDFVDLIISVHEGFDGQEISHAFGGALALAYVAEPRGTVDIDVNVFLPPEDIDRVAEVLAVLGYERVSGEDAAPISGVRFGARQEPFPIDVFTSIHERYADVEQRVVRYPFGREGSTQPVLPFISAEDLTVFKVSFGRPQDWVDLAKIAAARPDLDVDYVEALLVALRGPSMYPRMARLRGLFTSG